VLLCEERGGGRVGMWVYWVLVALASGVWMAWGKYKKRVARAGGVFRVTEFWDLWMLIRLWGRAMEKNYWGEFSKLRDGCSGITRLSKL